MAKEIERVSLLDISPPSITGDANVQHLISAIDPELLSVSQDIREAFIVSRINELPEEVLDLLAWQWHVDFYELAHSLDAKRDMVLKSIAWHRKKGTSQAIIDALAMLGVEAKFTSWQHEDAEPYTFAIDAKLTGDFWERVDWTKPTQTIRRAIQEGKAARSWMSRLYVYMETQGQHDIAIGTAIAQGIQHTLPLVQETHSEASNLLTVGTAIGQIHQQGIPLAPAKPSKSELNIATGTAIAQGIYHDLPIIQATHSSEVMPLTIGGVVAQKIAHTLPIAQATTATTNAQISAGCLMSCGIHIQLNMAA